jgi:hypothetical protein
LIHPAAGQAWGLWPPAESLGVLCVGAVEDVSAACADLGGGAEVDRGRRALLTFLWASRS